jgi:hypothetical protein
MGGLCAADQAAAWHGEQEYLSPQGPVTQFKLETVAAGAATVADIHVFQTLWAAAVVADVAKDVAPMAVRTLLPAVVVVW